MLRKLLIVAAIVLLTAAVVMAADSTDYRSTNAMEVAARHLNFQTDLKLDVGSDLRARSVALDEIGMSHVRYQQYYRGVRVFEGDAIAHVSDGAQKVVDFTDALYRGIRLVDVRPSISADAAREIAIKDMAPKGEADATAELVIYPGNKGRFNLAHLIRIEAHGNGDVREMMYVVNAKNGKIIDRWDDLHTSDANGTGNSQYSGTVSIKTNSISGGFELRDLTRGNGGNAIRNANHSTCSGACNGYSIYTDADNNWGDGNNYTAGGSTTNANGQTAAVDAAYGLQQTWDYFKNVHGRNGIDNTGKATFSLVHYSTGWVNASWSSSCFCMRYGDGNSSYSVLTSLDVAGHEMSHGVTATTANLTYRGESGGLNEATSDIFGEAVELTSGVPGTTGEWKIGEDLGNPPIRYMYKPSLDGASYDWYGSGIKGVNVHYSSGVANHFFYYLVNGVPAQPTFNYSPYLPGGMSGIGLSAAEKIWYRALTAYMTSKTDYKGARTATLSAAATLYGNGSAEYNAVNNAWKAVNVN